MKFWRLLPVLIFAGVLAAATVGVAAVQDIEDGHNFAAEGEQDARDCDGFEVEYGQTNGHVDRVKLHYAPGDTHLGDDCADEYVNVEVHDVNHDILGSCPPTQMSDPPASLSCPISPEIENDSNPGVKDIDHVNLVVTDLP